MKKSIFFLLFFINIINIFSQLSISQFGPREEKVYDVGTIFFKDSSQVKGKMKITYDLKLIHLVGNEKIVYDYRKIDKIDLKINDKNIDTYCFRKREDETVLLKRVINGNLEVFYDEFYETSGNLSSGFGLPISINHQDKRLVIKKYIGKKNQLEIIKLPKKARHKKLKKIMSKLSFNCNEALEKIKDKKSIKKYYGEKASIENIIKDFNSKCY